MRRPGQYVGLEINARRKDPRDADVTVAIAFPDTYGIGISHLGGQILYQLLNDLPGVACDRTYCPEVDAEAVMRERGIGLFGWESRCAIRDFDIVGFSLPYELCVTNVLTMLDLAGITRRAAERGQDEPIVIGGDALADTPEPLADFFDLFLPGDGEVSLPALVEHVRLGRRDGAAREETVLAAARSLPGVYAPALYRPRYNADNTLAAMEVLHDGVPEAVERSRLKPLEKYPLISAPLVPLSEGVHERVVIEIMRGCPNGCRFCQAGHTRLPVRWRSVDEIVASARSGLAATGFREISLLSLSTSDYPDLGELISRLNAEFAPRHVSISLPSLRVGSQLRLLPGLTSTVRKGGLTIAAEAARGDLRAAIRKDITDEDMLAGVRAAWQAGWRHVKVYFMAGLPGETDADVDGIFDLCRRLSDTRKDVDGQRGAISASVSWTVPKPHTPLQWCAMRDEEYFFSVRSRLTQLARRSPVSVKFHRIERSILEAVLCRGDRRVGAVIEAAWDNGARMDSWNEHFDHERWLAAFRQCGLDPAFHAHREIPTDELLPWGHIRCPRSQEWLLREYDDMRRALRERAAN